MRLISLSVTGGPNPTAFLDLADGLTVVHGASDTGKSFIVSAIDYVMGAKGVKDIIETESYHEIALAMEAGGETFTLFRPFDSEYVWRFEGSLHERPSSLEGVRLTAKHSHEDLGSVSGLLLNSIGMLGWLAAKNENGDTASISFRDLSHLIIGAEGKVLGDDNLPFLSGQWVNKTKERSILRCILSGMPDLPQEPGSTKRAISASKSKLRVIDDLLRNLLSDLQDAPSPIELPLMLSKVDTVLEDLGTRLRDNLDQMRALEAEDRTLREREEAYGERLQEVSVAIPRFELLLAQYQSDRQRITLLQEATTALGLLQTTECPLCGADLTPEHEGKHALTNWAEAMDAERSRTFRLAAGLEETIVQLVDEASSLRMEQDSITALREQVSAATLRLKQAAAPGVAEVSELSSRRDVLRDWSAKYAQLREIESFKEGLHPEGTTTPATIALSPMLAADLEREMRDVVKAWGLPGAETVTLNSEDFEIQIQGRPRRSRGKGYRGVLYAAQVVAFAQFCLRNDLPHPGVVIIDSPLVTFKSPKRDASGDDVPVEVADRFYAYLDETFLGQSVILENVGPSGPLTTGSIVEFTGNDLGRYGFFQSSPAT